MRDPACRYDPEPTGQIRRRRTLLALDSLAVVISSEDPDTRFIKSAFADWSIVIGSK